MAVGKVKDSCSNKFIFMSLSKNEITELIRKRRFAALYRYIDHLKTFAIKRKWVYGDTHGGYDAAAIPPHVYRHWYYRAMEISKLLFIECEPNDHQWIINQLLD